MSRRTRAALLLFLATSVVAPPARSALGPANVAGLTLRWDAPLGGVTGALLIENGVLYASSWSGRVYALDPDTGAERWRFPAGSLIPGGVIAVPGGNVCFGDWAANVYCLRANDGSLVWHTNVAAGPDDAVWSSLGFANGRLFVGIASHTDVPCTQGRMVALDVATGDVLWNLKTVPDRVCLNDTAVACSSPADCGGGECWKGLGGGVTAQPLGDPGGEFVYMNTVGCYTSPSIGDSDSMFKVRASTGEVIWKTRVTGPEQYGYCTLDRGVLCGRDAHCAGAGVGGTCTLPTDPAAPIKAYHDFGFLNGPLKIDVPGPGGPETLIVSGSKNGTLYAFHEADGTIAWTNAVLPVPVSPNFAGFGLFNGAIFYADGRIHAALNALIPKRVCDNNHRQGCTSDAACGTGHCLPIPPHLMAFDVTDGSTLWGDDIGESWSSVAVANGVVYAGTNTVVDDGTTTSSSFFAYDAATGTRLATFQLPTQSAGRAAVLGDTLFVPYGVGPGDTGVRAFSLCGNNTIDAGEECDPGAPDTYGCCTAACRLVTGECDDADPCTSGGTCVSGECTGFEVQPGAPCPADDDGNVCTDAVCDEAGACVQRFNTGPCNDGNACTAGDACVSGQCTATVTPGAPCTADDGNVCTDPVCSEAGACTQQFNTSACDDGDACTTGDRCANGQCAGSLDSTDALGCVVNRIVDEPCGDTPLPRPLAGAVGKRLGAVHKLLDRAAKLAAKGKTAKVEKLRASAGTRLDGIKSLTAKAVASRNARRHISAECKASVDALVERGRLVVSGFGF